VLWQKVSALSIVVVGTVKSRTRECNGTIHRRFQADKAGGVPTGLSRATRTAPWCGPYPGALPPDPARRARARRRWSTLKQSDHRHGALLRALLTATPPRCRAQRRIRAVEGKCEGAHGGVIARPTQAVLAFQEGGNAGLAPRP
jgi:hypothetical protein